MKTSNAKANENFVAQQFGKQKTPKMSAEGSLKKFYVHKTTNKNPS